MVAIHDLLYQLRLADQSMTQLFERQLGISLTRYQILCFLIDQSPCADDLHVRNPHRRAGPARAAAGRRPRAAHCLRNRRRKFL